MKRTMTGDAPITLKSLNPATGGYTVDRKNFELPVPCPARFEVACVYTAYFVLVSRLTWLEKTI